MKKVFALLMIASFATLASCGGEEEKKDDKKDDKEKTEKEK